DRLGRDADGEDRRALHPGRRLRGGDRRLAGRLRNRSVCPHERSRNRRVRPTAHLLPDGGGLEGRLAHVLRPERFCSFSAACFAARFSFSVLCAGFLASFFCLSAPLAMRLILPEGHTGCMKVEIWSDVVCPWCYIGRRRFESALARFEHAGEVEVEWKSFELDPNAPLHRGSTAEHLTRKYGMTLEQVARSH